MKSLSITHLPTGGTSRVARPDVHDFIPPRRDRGTWTYPTEAESRSLQYIKILEVI